MKLLNYIGNVFSGIFDPLLKRKITPAPENPKRIDLSELEKVFEDNFEGEAPDPSKWRDHSFPKQKSKERKGGYWSSSQSIIIDGKLYIRTDYKADGENGAGYYTRGIDTRGLFEQKYGYFECRCKLPAAEGLWAAFWLYSDEVRAGNSGKKATEIDIFESPLYKRKSMRNAVVSNLHYNGYGLRGRSKCLGVFGVEDPYNTFNTYGLEWNEKEYIFYINGVETCRSSFGGVSQSEEFIVLSVEVDGVAGKPIFGWSGDIRNNPDGVLPADFVVDYVRAYKYKDKV